MPTDAVNFGAYLQPFPNYPRVLGENIRWFAANGVTGVYMVTMPDAVSIYARLVAASLATDSQHQKNESIHFSENLEVLRKMNRFIIIL